MYFHWPVLASRAVRIPANIARWQTYYERTFRSRPSTNVVADLETISAWAQSASSSSTTIHRNVKYAKELFKAMIPLKMEGRRR